MFMERFCYRCRKWTDAGGCPIQSRTIVNNEDSPEYPNEWIVDERGPRCTAHEKNLPLTNAAYVPKCRVCARDCCESCRTDCEVNMCPFGDDDEDYWKMGGACHADNICEKCMKEAADKQPALL